VIEDTPEQLAVIRTRQLACAHSFIKGACDTTKRCPKCGVSHEDWEQMAPPLHLQVTYQYSNGVP
jgi:hypothetical protein